MSDTTETTGDQRLVESILEEKRRLGAVILAHSYQTADIQDIADFVGDSLELARRAKGTEAPVIVLAGVHFMAETAKILNPHKRVLYPDLDAGCTLAESAPAFLFRRFRERHPDHLALTYINSTAEVKALSDIVCTSSNAERLLRHIPPEIPVLFAPDRNLGAWIARETGRRLLLWQGTCIVHERLDVEKARALRNTFPDAVLLAHPECEEPMLAIADFIGSTGAMLRFVEGSPAHTFIVATEEGLLHRMRRVRPDARFIAVPSDTGEDSSICPYMKRNTLQGILDCLRNGTPEVTLDEALRQSALAPIERMLALDAAEPGTRRDIIEGIPLPFSRE
ncbi:MAG: quinolinate synthase NadA [Bacteroidota bacterium]|nr:quinolinate synthase NadA [Bacteroidota bacterium]